MSSCLLVMLFKFFVKGSTMPASLTFSDVRVDVGSDDDNV